MSSTKDIIIPTGQNYSVKHKFEGNPWYNYVAMHYLNKKFPNNCVIIPTRNEPTEHTDVSLRWIQTDGQNGFLNIPDNFWDNFRKHLDHSNDKNFIVFPFGFTCSKTGGHANYMIYDIKNKILERFDSLGDKETACLQAKDLDKKILKMFKDNMGDGFVFHYLKPFNKFKIFQELQDEEKVKKLSTDPKYGFCSVWACWYVELRMLNPDIPRDELIELVLNYLLNNEDSLTEFIRDYSQNIVRFQEKLGKKLRKKSKRRSKSRSKRRRRRKSKSKSSR